MLLPAGVMDEMELIVRHVRLRSLRVYVRTLNIRCVYRELYTLHDNRATHGKTGCFESTGVCCVLHKAGLH